MVVGSGDSGDGVLGLRLGLLLISHDLLRVVVVV